MSSKKNSQLKHETGNFRRKNGRPLTAGDLVTMLSTVPKNMHVCLADKERRYFSIDSCQIFAAHAILWPVDKEEPS